MAGCTTAPAGLFIRSVSPKALPLHQGALLLVSGGGFRNGDAIRLGDVDLPPAIWINDGLLSAQLPDTLPAGSYDVIVIRRDGREAMKAGALRIGEPSAAQPPTLTGTATAPPPTARIPTPARTRRPSTTVPPSQPSTAEPVASFDVLAAVVKAFYTNLGQRRFPSAYALLSPAFQAKHSYQLWLQGYVNTDGFCVDIYPLTTPNTVFVQIVATDLMSTGATAQSSYSGTWSLIENAQGRWLLDHAAISGPTSSSVGCAGGGGP